MFSWRSEAVSDVQRSWMFIYHLNDHHMILNVHRSFWIHADHLQCRLNAQTSFIRMFWMNCDYSSFFCCSSGVVSVFKKSSQCFCYATEASLSSPPDARGLLPSKEPAVYKCLIRVSVTECLLRNHFGRNSWGDLSEYRTGEGGALLKCFGVRRNILRQQTEARKRLPPLTNTSFINCAPQQSNPSLHSTTLEAHPR